MKPNSRQRLKKHVIMLYVEPEQDAALRALCARTGKTQQHYLRAGLDYVLKRNKAR